MHTYTLHEVRAEFSKIFDRALSGEPQRVTRHGKEAVVIVSEEQWSKRPNRSPTLGHLLADFAERVGFDEGDFDRSWCKQERELGADFLKDD